MIKVVNEERKTPEAGVPIGTLAAALALAAVVALGGATPVAAEDDESADRADDGDRTEYVEVDATYLPQTNTVATKLPLPLRLTPAHVGVLGSELFWEQAGRTLTDVLPGVSGLNVQPGGGVYDQFYVRGFDSLNSGLLLIDGAPEPEVSFYNLYNVTGVEVVKGPAGFLYGSNPLAGAVNLVRKQPLPGRFLNAGLTAGSFGTYTGNVDWNASNAGGSTAFRLNALYTETEGYRDGQEGQMWAVNPGVAWQVGERHRFNLNAELARPEFTPDAGIPLIGGTDPAEVSRTRSFSLPGDFSEQDLQRFQLDYDYRFDERVRFRAKLYSRGLDWQTRGTQFVGAFPAMIVTIPGVGDVPVPETGLRIQTDLDDDQHLFGGQFEAVTRWETGSVTHNLLTGWEFSRFTDEFDILISPVSQDPIADAGSAPAPAVFFPFQSGDVTTEVAAPYVVDQMSFGERVQLFLGARYDAIDFRDAVSGRSRTDTELSPMAGLVVAPGERLSFYANAGRTFAPPSPRATNGFEPERSTQYEIGVKKGLGARSRLTAAVYRIERENIAIPDANLVTQQIGDQESQGFELELAASPSPGFHILAAYAYNDAELTRFAESVQIGQDMLGQPIFQLFDRSGNEPAFAPEHMLSSWVSKKLGRGFGLAGGIRYVGEQFIAEDNVFEIDDVTLVDAAAFWERDAYRVRVNFKNVLNEEYLSRGFGTYAVIPAPKFEASAHVEYRFR